MSSEKQNIIIDYINHEAAKYACKHWHYSKQLPATIGIKYGCWEDNEFIGCVVFSQGANRNIGKPYSLDQTRGLELVRVAFKKHTSPLSKILMHAVNSIKKTTKIRLIVSYADANEGHHGGIYQATNWIYTGQSKSDYKYLCPDGVLRHKRQVSTTGYIKNFSRYDRCYKRSECKKIITPGKYKYLMPLDKKMRKQILPLAKPYPKPDK